jgi:PhnB protein
MALTSTYLNFARNTEEAFYYYKSVFGGDFVDGKINRFGEIPPQEGAPPIAEADKNLVMHVALPILGGHLLMGTDAPESMGFHVNQGNNVYIALHTDSRTEADKLFSALSKGGNVEMPLTDMFWGDYFSSFSDKFGIKWMVIHTPK